MKLRSFMVLEGRFFTGRAVSSCFGRVRLTSWCQSWKYKKPGTTLEQINAKGNEAKVFCNDICMEEKVQEMFPRLRTKWGRLKFLS